MAQIRLGLRENWQQFTLLVVINRKTLLDGPQMRIVLRSAAIQKEALMKTNPTAVGWLLISGEPRIRCHIHLHLHDLQSPLCPAYTNSCEET